MQKKFSWEAPRESDIVRSRVRAYLGGVRRRVMGYREA